MSSAPLRFSGCGIPSPPLQRLRGFYVWSAARVPAGSARRRSGDSSSNLLISPRLCSINDGNEAIHTGDVQEPSPNLIGPRSKMEDQSVKDQSVKAFSSKELMQKLKRYGVAGVLSYGLLSTAYYLLTFLVVWFYVSPAPRRMGFSASVQRFLKLMAVVWAGSQVTKILRATGALALAPFVDRGLCWFTDRFKFGSKGKAFVAVVCLCYVLDIFVFFGLTLLWA